MLPQFIKRCKRALCELLTHTTIEWEVFKKNIGQMDYLRKAVGCRLREMLPLLGDAYQIRFVGRYFSQDEELLDKMKRLDIVVVVEVA
jgi:hypothetical protein